jgi:hypothetical protein
MDTTLSPTSAAATVGTHPWRHFVRCYIEMNIVMLVGMGVAIKLFTSAVGALIEPITWQDALVVYPAQALLVMSIGMTLPMIAWMRHRRFTWRLTYEMAAAMLLPAVPLICLALFGLIEGAQCGLHCVATAVAMLGLMLYRRAEYSGTGHRRDLPGPVPLGRTAVG